MFTPFRPTHKHHNWHNAHWHNAHLVVCCENKPVGLIALFSRSRRGTPFLFLFFACSFYLYIDMIWYDMIWYDMIWFYLHKIAALRPNYNVQYNTREKKNTQYDQKQSLKYNNRQQRSRAKLWSRRAKKKIESKKSNYGSLLLINST